MACTVWDGLAARLEGEIVVLEPLDPRHEDGLWTAAQDPAIWTWTIPRGKSPEHFRAWFQASLRAGAAGEQCVFATLDRTTGEPIGSTGYHELRQEHRGLEIGGTWLAPSMWRTGANIEAKLLMLEHAFERLGCMRVEFKTDSRNERSRAALEALPAQFEGIFRRHMTIEDVGVRDSAYYSITDLEWPDVRTNLRRRLAAVRARNSEPVQ
ncbi:MAG TPA: GNAT family N-acetyltransferase [Solirubrobacteraceae bacterium]|nr:GNAT family N-acetyltransferase [Solirubrobacteraceae bacterium]